MVRAKRLLAVGLIGLLAVSGCSTESPGEPTPANVGNASGLAGALQRVQSTPETRQSLSYGDVAAVQQLIKADERRFRLIDGTGLDHLFNYRKLIQEGIDLDLSVMREAITAGVPPRWAGIVIGDYDVAAVDKRIAARDVPQETDGDATVWTSGANGEINLDSGPFQDMVQLSEFNNIRTEPGAFSYAPMADALAWVTKPEGQRLAEDEGMSAAASCLGDVVAARLVRDSNAPDVVVAVGVRAPSASEVTEVVCFGSPNGDAEELRARITTALEQAGGEPAGMLSDAEVGVDGSTVRLVLTPGADEPVGRTLQLLQDGTLIRLVSG